MNDFIWKIEEKDLSNYFELYTICVYKIIENFEIIDFIINEHVFYLVMAEVCKDLKAIFQRRLKNGISVSKIMGIIVFRLSKSLIVQICSPSFIEDFKKREKINYLQIYINIIASLLFAD